MWVGYEGCKGLREITYYYYTFASESRLAGSAGITTSIDLVSTAITPMGIPPSLSYWE